MVNIKKLQLKNQYRIVWLRYVNGVDLSQHCMKCLKGYNDPRFRGFMVGIENANLDTSKYYYLCGVDKSWKYDNNMHIAFIEKKGSCIKIENDLFSIEIEDAERLEISNKYIDWSLQHADNKLYNTCRNWWFANMLIVKDKDVRENYNKKLKLL